MPTPLLALKHDMLATLMSDKVAWDFVGNILADVHFSVTNQPVFNAVGTQRRRHAGHVPAPERRDRRA